MIKNINRKKILHELAMIKKYDLAHYADKINSLNTSYETTTQANKEVVNEDLKYITENFYTFLGEPPKDKPFFLIRKLIFSFLFKYTFRQVRFNDHLRNLLLKMNQSMVQDNEKIDRLDEFTKNINEKIDRLDEFTKNINEKIDRLDEFTKNINEKIDRLDEFTKNINEIYLDVNKNIAITQKNIDELYYNNIWKESKLNALEEKIEILEHNNSSLSPDRFFSQFGEDRWIINNLKIPKMGTFIDIGTADGITFSNTYYFEKLGWHGICFEPDPDNFNKAKKCRNNVIKAAISNKNSILDFYMSSISSDWSSLKPTKYYSKVIKIKTYTLSEILEKKHISSIDILSIDTEGTEIDVWKSLDLSKIRPKIVIVEFVNQGKKNFNITSIFTKSDYKLVHTTYANHIFIDNKK